jgi:hypothetical protein
MLDTAAIVGLYEKVRERKYREIGKREIGGWCSGGPEGMV